MKKLLLVVVLAVSALNIATAQEENLYKAQGGNWNAELNFSPFSSSPVSLNYIRLRKFSSNTNAIRLGVSLGFESDKPEEDITLSEIELNLRPGFEQHFGGTDRLSPYIGGELDVAIKSVNFKDTDQDYTIKGAWSDTGNNRGYFRVGLNFIVGADYYIAKKLYIGTEFGYGLELINSADIVVEDEFDRDPLKGGSSVQLGPNFNSSLRLGFIF